MEMPFPGCRHFGLALSLPTSQLVISTALITTVPKDSDQLVKLKSSHQWEDCSSAEAGSQAEQPQNGTVSLDDETCRFMRQEKNQQRISIKWPQGENSY